jgi:hypothetical protein
MAIGTRVPRYKNGVYRPKGTKGSIKNGWRDTTILAARRKLAELEEERAAGAGDALEANGPLKRERAENRAETPEVLDDNLQAKAGDQ